MLLDFTILVSAKLAHDTAPSGGTNTDGITFDPTIIGTVIDASQVAQFSAGFDIAQPAKFVNVLAQRNTHGSFTFTRSQLETIYGGTLPDGSHTLHLQAHQVYHFSGTAGQRLYFNSISSNANLDWVLYGGDNQVIWQSGWSDVETVLPTDGPYVLALRGKAAFSDRVPYTFQIVDAQTVNGTLSLGNNTTPNTVNGNIALKGEQDTYSFTGTAGQRVDFDVLKDGGYYTDTATLKSPSGITYFNRNLTDGDSFPFTLNENGTYELVLDGVGGNTGAYSFSMLDVGQATPISLDTDVTGTLTSGSSTQLYQFNGTGGQHLYFNSLSNVSGNWYIYDSGNNRVTGTSLGSDFELTLSKTDTYTLVMQGGGSQGTDDSSPINYKFRVIASNTPTTPLSLGSNATPNVVSGSITKKGDVNTYTFTGTAGEQLYFDTISSAYYTTQATLKSPSGIQLFSRNLSDGDYGSFTLLENGNYSLVIDGANASTDSYSFRLADGNTATPVTLGTAFAGSLPANQVQLYQINGISGQRLQFNNLTSVSNADWVLYGSAGNVFAFASLGNAGIGFETALPTTGAYVLAVRNFTGSPVNFNVQVND